MIVNIVVKDPDTFEEKKKILNDKFNFYQTYLDIYKMWKELFRIRDGLSEEFVVNNTIKSIANEYSVQELNNMGENEISKLLIENFYIDGEDCWEIEMAKHRIEDIENSLKNNDVNELYLILSTSLKGNIIN